MLCVDLTDVQWQINGKPTFLLNDFRKKVDKNVKNARYVTAFRQSLAQQKVEKQKQVRMRLSSRNTYLPRAESRPSLVRAVRC